MTRRIPILLCVLVGLGLGIQLVPYGRDHANPDVVREPAWDRPATRELFFRACKDCHSHGTAWPWYSWVAPASWLVQWDVERARSHFNVSSWGRNENHGGEAAERVRAGEMPPATYRLAHPESRLSLAERRELIAGLVATFGEEADHGAREPAHDHERAH